MADFALAGHVVLGFEGVRLGIDGVFEAEAIGCRITAGDRRHNPTVVEHPFRLDAVRIPRDFLDRARIPLLLKALHTLKRRLATDIPVTGAFMGPITVTGHLVGMENLLRGLIEKPQMVAQVLSEVSSACIRMGTALADAGVDVLQFPDPLASTDLISPQMYARFALPCHQKVIHKVDCPVVLHICGNSTPILTHVRESGASGFSFDAHVPVAHVKQVLGDVMSLVGNVSSSDVLLRQDRASVRKATREAIGQGVDILASSCGLAPGTPLVNVREMILSSRN
jgi:[methyl-Co(III) methanol-specific corrinoid protein]:coenzyme M methyltransferase